LLVLMTFFCPAMAAEDEKEKPKLIDKKVILISSFLFASEVFETEATFASLENSNYREINPVMRPVVKKGHLATHALKIGIDAGIMYCSTYHLKKNGIKWWWVLPIVATATQVSAGSFNMQFAF